MTKVTETNGRNALAELAGWLKRLVDANGGKKCHAVANIDKAQRIVEELAKVNDCLHREGVILMYTPEEKMAVMAAVDRCIAIAEEVR